MGGCLHTPDPAADREQRVLVRTRPWLALYGMKPRHLEPRFNDCLAMFQAAVRSVPAAPALRYFDGVLDYRTLGTLSDRLALDLGNRGIGRGDRIAIIFQNIPQFPIAVIACWKIGAIPMPCNPMYSERELVGLFKDGEPRLVMCQTDRIEVTRAALNAVGLRDEQLLVASPATYQSRNDRRVLDVAVEGDSFTAATAGSHGSAPPPDRVVSPDEAGLLLYTSGTTGRPKGAVLAHRALAFNAETSFEWFELGTAASILALAPLFHITGFVCHFCAALRAQGFMVLTYRFHPDVVLEAIREARPSFAIGAITAYNALMKAPAADPEAFASFHRLYSGGAPIPPALVAQFLARTGQRILPAHGMTETAAPTHVAPPTLVTPTDSRSGAFSIGIPTSDVDAMIVDEMGNELSAGQPGELLLRGPQLLSGYWCREAETREALADGWLHTGDVAVMDDHGWFYIVDRKKDVIIASGFKVWPREVEDVLYLHEGIREAAVIGIPDEYRGETVKACVSLVPGVRVEPAELIAFCRQRLAAYKVPCVIEILDDLPKTATGKLMRAALRPPARADADSDKRRK